MQPSKQPVNLAGQLILAAMFLAMVLPFIGSKYINGQIMKEQRLVLTVYGAGPGGTVNRRADDWFRLWAIRTGLMEKAIHALDPKPVVAAAATVANPIVIKDSSGRFGTLNAQNGEGNQKERHVWYWWITAAFALVYFAMLRMSVLILWLPMLVPLIVAVMLTGNTTQRLKWHGFGGVNPFRYRAGVRLASWAPALAVGALFLPGALPPFVVPALVLMTFVGLAMRMANMTKPA